MTSYHRQCDQNRRQRCASPHACMTGCHFNEATLNQWDGEAHVDTLNDPTNAPYSVLDWWLTRAMWLAAGAAFAGWVVAMVMFFA